MRCTLKCLKLTKKGNGGFIRLSDYPQFVAVKSIFGGYEIVGESGNLYRVKTSDLVFHNYLFHN
jgi:hypothetical protein